MFSIGIIIILFFGLFNTGIINKTKNFLSGRKGPPVIQSYRDMIKHLRKGSVFSKTSSWITQIAPTLNLTCVLVSLLFIPFGHYGSFISFNGDVVAFAYVLALGRFFMMLAALDAGSAFQGMGTNREALYSLLIEPIFFILIGAIALITGNTSMGDIFATTNANSLFGYQFEIIAIITLFMITLAENKRIPFDDPKTHLELTMIHEVMILDYSGFDFGIIQLTTGIKHALYAGLIGQIIIPDGLPLAILVLVYVLIQVVVMVVIGVVESVIPRYRMNKNPRYMISLISLSMIAMIIALILKNI